MAPKPYVFGHGYGFGGAPFGGKVGLIIAVPELGRGLPSLISNDRHQVIALVAEGNSNRIPQFRGWLGEPPEWGQIIGASAPEQLPPFWATDEDGFPVIGDLELPFLPVGTKSGTEATVSGVLVEFEPRPTALGTFDGGLPVDTELGFDVTVEGWRTPTLAVDVESQLALSGVARSDTQSVAIAAQDVASHLYPNIFAVWMPCRIDGAQHVRSVRVQIANIRHCRIVSVEVHGRAHPSRYG